MKDWASVPIGDVCHVIGGGTPRKSNREFYVGSIPWATVRDMKSDLLSTTECHISDEAVEASSTNIIPAGNVVIATRVGLGKVCLLQNDTAINQDLRGIVPKKAGKIEPRFLLYWFKVVAPTILSAGTGMTVKGVRLDFVRSLSLPLPSLAEQERIVAILDEAFAAIATATANAEKNLANARELFESYLDNIFTRKGDSWSETMLNELCAITHGFAFKGKDFTADNDPNKPIVITPGNFTEEASLSFTDKNTKRFYGDPPDGFTFDVGDLVIVMTDLSSKMKILGKPALIDRNSVLHNQRIGKLIFKDNSLDRKFLYYFFKTTQFLEDIKKTATGTMVKHTAPKRILSNTISYPSEIAKQKAIVALVDTLTTKSRCLRDLYQGKLDSLDELKQSILHKVFTGELAADSGVADRALSEAGV